MKDAPKEVLVQVDALVDHLNGEQLLDLAVGLIGKGAFRIGKQLGDQAAYEILDSVTSVIVPMKHDFLRNANRKAAVAK